MTRKNIIASLFAYVLAISCLFAANTKPVDKTRRAKPSPEKIAEMKMQYLGGDLIDYRKQKGKVFVINAQTVASDALVKASADYFAQKVQIVITNETGKFSMPKPDVKGNATVYVVDDTLLPMSLVAPEARWAVVNIAHLKTEKKAYFESRVNKEIYRTLCHLLGVASSKWPNCATGCITKAEDLDLLPKLTFPVEFKERFKSYLPLLGIEPWRMSDYRKACIEGWAPAPTNEYQQVVWDKIHAPPEKPLKITYDKDKQKPVVK